MGTVYKIPAEAKLKHPKATCIPSIEINICHLNTTMKAKQERVLNAILLIYFLVPVQKSLQGR